MSDFVVSASLFTGEPVDRTVTYPNGVELIVSLLPVTGDLEAEYAKKRGLDEHTLAFKPNTGDNPDDPEMEISPIERKFSKAREVGANKWLAEKVVKGWPRGPMMDNGEMVEFNDKNLKLLAADVRFIRPILDEAYVLGSMLEQAEAGNSET